MLVSTVLLKNKKNGKKKYFSFIETLTTQNSQWFNPGKFPRRRVRLINSITLPPSCSTLCRMGAVVLLFAVFLLDSCEAKGSSTVIPVFVRTGTNLLLDVKKPVTLNEDSDFTWKYNGTKNIVRVSGNNNPKYFKEGAAVFGNYSLLLKNVQQNDSGMYKAQISAAEDKTVAEYKVTVQDPVSAVNLTVNCSSATNLTVTCSTVDSDISSTFSCDKQACSQERSDATIYPSFINLYLDERFIICNHSNHVSWEQKKEVKSVCEPPPVPDVASRLTAVFGIPTAVIAIGFCICLFIIYKKKNNTGNTVYEVPQDIDRTRPLNQNPTEDAAGPSLNSTYCLVQFHTGPAESTSHKNEHPETVYAQVNRAAKKKNRSPQNQSTELENIGKVFVQS